MVAGDLVYVHYTPELGPISIGLIVGYHPGMAGFTKGKPYEYYKVLADGLVRTISCTCLSLINEI